MAKQTYRGPSRQVRKVTLVAPETSVSDLSRRVQSEKVSAILGFKARAAEEARIKQRVHEQYAGTYIYSQMLLIFLHSFL